MPSGRIKTDFGLLATHDVARDTAIQADGKIIVAGEVNGNFALLRYNVDGSLDTTFHDDGKVLGQSGAAYGIALQGDGSIIVAGSFGGDFRLARYLADGSLDTSFGAGGFVTHNISGTDAGADVIIQADGKIVVVGSAGADFALARYNANGTLDTSFDVDGKLITDVIGTDAGAGAIVQADGKIVVAGSAFIGSGANFALVRYNVNGSLDTSFGIGGKRDFTFGLEDIATSIALQADGKLVIAGYTNAGGTNDFAVARVNANGTLDTSFDGDGKVTTNFGNDDRANSVAIQNDGKILVAGSWDGGASDFAIARYNTNGSLDTTFSGDGRVNLTFGSTGFGAAEFAYSIKVQADGKILIVGTTNSDTAAGDNDFALARLNADGSFDTTFGGTGKIKTDVGFTGTVDTARDLAVQADGKFVVAGDTDGRLALARYNVDGTLDLSFSGDGKVADLLGIAYGVAIQGDGKIVVAGGTTGDFRLARYTTAGVLDSTFGATGVVTTDFGGADSGRDVFVQADGKIVVVGTSGADFAIARYNADGTADLGFGAAGKLITDVSGTDAGAGAIVQADGKIVVAGSASFAPGTDFAVVRYNVNGSLDTSFGSSGKATFSFGVADVATSIALQADGKLVIAGYTNVGGTNDFAVARVNANGTLDTSFDGDGLVTTNFSNDDRANSVAIQSDGKILVAGSWDGGASDFAIARYNTNGSLDTTFSGDGRVNLTFGSTGFGAAEFAYSIKVQADGKILIVGTTNSDTAAGADDFALARLNADGSIDATFVGNGEIWDGTAAGDIHFGTDANDSLRGLGGDDDIRGGGGSDVLNGGAGADRLDGEAGNDTADYSAATTTAVLHLDTATQYGQYASGFGGAVETDTLISIENLIGGSDGDYLYGDALANVLTGNGGNDYIEAWLGNDTIFGGAGQEFIDASYGADTVDGGADGDTIYGGADNDILRGGADNDFIYGDHGADQLFGDAGTDVLFIDAADTVYDGGAGIDYIVWQDVTVAANLDVTAHSADYFYGYTGNDTVTANGATARPELHGGGGGDTLSGSATVGSILLGEAGNDRLIGNTGIDHFVGGADADTIVVSANGGTDYFYDYQDGSDRINVAGTGVTTFAGLTIDNTYAASNWYGVGYGTGTLWVNTGGVGALGASDFIFV